MRIHSVEAIAVDIPLTKNFGGSTYAVLKRSTVITRMRTDEGLVSEVYNGDNREHGARDRPPDPRRAGPAPARRAHLRGRAHLGGAVRRQPPEPRQEDASWRRSPAWTPRSGTWSARRWARASRALLGGYRAAAAHHLHRRLLHGGQDARRHRPRDGSATGAPAWRAASSRWAGSRPRRTPSGSRRRARRRGRISSWPSTPTAAGPSRRDPLRPADRAARHRAGSRSRATGTTTWR